MLAADRLPRIMFAFCWLLFLSHPAPAAINAFNLDSSHGSARSKIIFRVYSSRATRIEVDPYTSAMNSGDVLRVQLNADTSTNIFSGSLPVAAFHTDGVTGPLYYGYRAWRPNWVYSTSGTKGSGAGFLADVDAWGNRFNPNKLLIDPYPREIIQGPMNATWTDGIVYASGVNYRNLDSGTMTSKSILWAPVSQSVRVKPTRTPKDDIIYEVNFPGLTKNDTSIPEALQGTFAGRC